MVNCSTCNHANPDGAVTCEACFAPLPTLQRCPQCGAPVMSDANFCGQCGYNLQTRPPIVPALELAHHAATPGPTSSIAAPDGARLPTTSPAASSSAASSSAASMAQLWHPAPSIAPDPAPIPGLDVQQPLEASELTTNLVVAGSSKADLASDASSVLAATGPVTQLQRAIARFVHISTNAVITLPEHLNPIHIGKPNDLVPPDLDLSGLPNAEVVSRIHADIRIEGDAYYLEDVGSANGTYVNGLPLVPGNRHRLRPGDRLAFGKHDLVSFWFQLGS
ncbi:MAG: FHA domain-containing protein [Oscillatoriales cyanobacterium]|nr:MAG: FHA domain-containing protein [Oscillatoriales cyanobacterium]